MDLARSRGIAVIEKVEMMNVGILIAKASKKSPVFGDGILRICMYNTEGTKRHTRGYCWTVAMDNLASQYACILP